MDFDDFEMQFVEDEGIFSIYKAKKKDASEEYMLKKLQATNGKPLPPFVRKEAELLHHLDNQRIIEMVVFRIRNLKAMEYGPITRGV